MEKIKKHIGFHYLKDPKHLAFAVILAVGGIFGFRYSIYAYPEVFNVEIKAENVSQINPEEAIIIRFSQPVFGDSYKDALKIEPSQNIRTEWSDSGKKLEIHPDKFWKNETDYTITLGNGESRMFIKVDGKKIKFSTADYPKVSEFYPEEGEKDVIMDIENPIAVKFNKSTEGYFIKLGLNPESEIIYDNNPDKTQFRLLSKKKLEEGVRYDVSVYVKYLADSDSNYKKIYSSSFETLPPPPKEVAKDLNLRLEQAKKYTVPKLTSGKYIDINLTSQVMTIFENGSPIDAFIISSGKRGMETPKGKHAIYNKFPRAYSRAYNLFMPYWMAITSDGKVGIHELPEWPGGYKEGADHLGTPVSHGCVRLGIGPAGQLYNWVQIGTPVVVYSNPG